VTPNEIELGDLAREVATTGSTSGKNKILDQLHKIGERTKGIVIVTLGGDGCAVRLTDGQIHQVPARSTSDVVDTTGAGDTFNGVLAARLAAGDVVITAVRTAVIAASLSVSAVGARPGMPSYNKIASVSSQ